MVALISIIAAVITIYAICKHNKLRALVTSLALQQVKEVKVENMENVDYNCVTHWEFRFFSGFSGELVSFRN